MKNLKTYLIIFLVVTLGLIPFVPGFSSIDMMAPHYLYLSITQFIISLYLIFTNKKESVTLSIVDFSYILFLFFGLLSFHKSINLTESFIEWSQFLTLFITYFNLKTLFKKLENRKKVFLIILLSLLAIESLFIFNVFIENYSLEFGMQRIRELSGLSSNQNIGAFSLLIKIPFLLFLFYISKRNVHKLLLALLFTISVFDILIISSRAAIIGLIFIFTLVLLIEIFKPKDPNFRFKLSTVFLPLLIGLFVLQTSLYENSKETISINRISSFNDESVSNRIDYFGSAINLFLENPIFGIGIGNWKLVSVKNLGDKMKQYNIPFHTHNDLLQIASEIGFLGFICFLLIIITPILYLLKKFYHRRVLYEITPFLLMAFIIYFLDSNINFPRIRPYSQMNFIFLLSFFSSNFELKRVSKKIEIKKIMMVFLVLIIPLNFIHATYLSSYREITTLYIDYNENGDQLEAPIELIEGFQDSFPNITNAVIPIKLAKANYFYQKGEYSKAKHLIRQGRIHNPYLGFGDFLMGKIFKEEKQLDSALFFTEKAYNKISANTGHAALYQALLIELKMFDKEQEVFERTKFLNDEILWVNHVFALLKDSIKVSNSNFSQKDKTHVKEAMKIFPNNLVINAANVAINSGIETSFLVEQFDAEANKYYKNKEYQLAIDYWTEAKLLIPQEDSYRLNIAMSYCRLKEYNKAIEVLRSIEIDQVGKSKDGMFEFVSGYSFLGLNKLDLACKYLRASQKLGYVTATRLLETINCQTK